GVMEEDIEPVRDLITTAILALVQVRWFSLTNVLVVIHVLLMDVYYVVELK
ncbi:14365_t:CDS:2, partial [Racocetra persica]